MSLPWPVAAAAAFALLAAILVGGIYLLVQIHDMSSNLARLTAQMNTLQTMNSKLDSLTMMNRRLTEVDSKLDTTNMLLRMSNQKLSAALVSAEKTTRSLDEMQGRLGAMTGMLAAVKAPLMSMQATLGSMQADIGRMTQKIIHAKLLF